MLETHRETLFTCGLCSHRRGVRGAVRDRLTNMGPSLDLPEHPHVLRITLACSRRPAGYHSPMRRAYVASVLLIASAAGLKKGESGAVDVLFIGTSASFFCQLSPAGDTRCIDFNLPSLVTPWPPWLTIAIVFL